MFLILSSQFLSDLKNTSVLKTFCEKGKALQDETVIDGLTKTSYVKMPWITLGGAFIKNDNR